MTGSSWPTAPTPVQRKLRYVAFDKGESNTIFQEVEEDADNDEIQEATGQMRKKPQQ